MSDALRCAGLRRRATVGLAGVLAAGVVAGVAPASASVEPDQRPCVSRSEYLTIRDSWHHARIDHHTDTVGVLVETRANGVSRWEYAGCRDGVMVVEYRRGRWLSIGWW